MKPTGQLHHFPCRVFKYSGFTLIEVAIAVCIFMILTAFGFSFFVLAGQSTKDGDLKNKAVEIAMRYYEEITWGYNATPPPETYKDVVLTPTITKTTTATTLTNTDPINSTVSVSETVNVLEEYTIAVTWPSGSTTLKKLVFNTELFNHKFWQQ
jgi:type II secretory pathway pseudopilin PulG